MANRPAAALALREGDREVLARLMRATSGRAGLAQRARIVLLAADGESNTAIADKVGVSRPTVIGWRSRYAERGLQGLDDDQRSGRPRLIDHRRIVSVTFKFSTDPELVAKVCDVVGLYLAPPEKAIVLCVDEKSQIQALDRTQKMLPMQPGRPERRTYDYVRHGTTTLFAALEIATGTVTGACKPRHRHQEFLAFLKQVARAYPDAELHLVMDNYATHKRVEVRDWLAANPRITTHFTPTSGSWLNLVEVWFGIIERQAIRRGTFNSVRDLNAKIRAFVNGWNERCHPFVWTRTADDILKKANRQTTSNTDH